MRASAAARPRPVAARAAASDRGHAGAASSRSRAAAARSPSSATPPGRSTPPAAATAAGPRSTPSPSGPASRSRWARSRAGAPLSSAARRSAARPPRPWRAGAASMTAPAAHRAPLGRAQHHAVAGRGGHGPAEAQLGVAALARLQRVGVEQDAGGRHLRRPEERLQAPARAQAPPGVGEPLEGDIEQLRGGPPVAGAHDAGAARDVGGADPGQVQRGPPARGARDRAVVGLHLAHAAGGSAGERHDPVARGDPIAPQRAGHDRAGAGQRERPVDEQARAAAGGAPVQAAGQPVERCPDALDALPGDGRDGHDLGPARRPGRAPRRRPPPGAPGRLG